MLNLLDGMRKAGFTDKLIKAIFYFDILTLCTRGHTNEEIAEYTGLLKSDIKEILLELLDFEGWKEKQIDFLELYLNNNLTNSEKGGIICNKLNDLEKEIDKVYDKTN